MLCLVVGTAARGYCTNSHRWAARNSGGGHRRHWSDPDPPTRAPVAGRKVHCVPRRSKHRLLSRSSWRRPKGSAGHLAEDSWRTNGLLCLFMTVVAQDCGAASCAIVTLLDKRERRKVVLEPEYVGFQVRF
jgi:hypothetical protein